MARGSSLRLARDDHGRADRGARRQADRAACSNSFSTCAGAASSIVLISHNMPHVFEIADRIHIHRLGRRLTVIDPKSYTMSDAVSFMTGARLPVEIAA